MLGDFVPHEFYYLARLKFDYLNKNPLSDFYEEVVTDPKVLDPKTERPIVNRLSRADAGYYVLTNGYEGLNFSRKDYGVLQTLDYDKLKEVLAQNKYKNLVYQWPPDTVKVMVTLLKDMGLKDQARKYLEIKVEEGKTAQPWERRYDNSTNHFMKYCGACHLTESSLDYETTSLPLESADRLSRVRGICSSLKEKRMPPRKYKWQPTAVELDDMLNELNCKK
jgi:hypothetical protein